MNQDIKVTDSQINGQIAIAKGDVTQIQDSIVNITITPEELGVTKSALKSFFKILGQEQVAHEDLDNTLREIARKYKKLQDKIKIVQSDDSIVLSLKKQASEALDKGDFGKVDNLLNQASVREIEIVKDLQQTINEHLLSAAKIKAEIGDSKNTQLAYSEAAKYFQQASKIVPPEFKEVSSDYLNQAGFAYHKASEYEQALSLYQKALESRETPDIFFNIALIYDAQNEYEGALPFYQMALEAYDKLDYGVYIDYANKIFLLGLPSNLVSSTLMAAAAKYAQFAINPNLDNYYEQTIKLYRKMLIEAFNNTDTPYEPCNVTIFVQDNTPARLDDIHYHYANRFIDIANKQAEKSSPISEVLNSITVASCLFSAFNYRINYISTDNEANEAINYLCNLYTKRLNGNALVVPQIENSKKLKNESDKSFAFYMFSDNPENDAINIFNLIMLGKKLILVFSGYDNDKREIYEIPECLNHFNQFCIALMVHHGIEDVPNFLVNNMFTGDGTMDGVSFVKIMIAKIADIDIQIIKE